MNNKFYLKCSFLISLFLFSFQSAHAEKYRLACKVKPLDLSGTSLGERGRFLNNIMDFDIDTEVGIYSPDLREETDEVILHGLWPETNFNTPLKNQELAWKNELLINDGMTEGEWTYYKYNSYLSKKRNKNKPQERILNITIQDYRLAKNFKIQNYIKLLEDKKREDLKNNKISEEEFNQWLNNKDNLSDKEIADLPKKLNNTFNFEFNCNRSEV